MHSQIPRRRRQRAARSVVLAVAVGLLAAGCSSERLSRGFLPGPAGVTNQTDRITALWNGSWIAALIVGLITWGLILWCVAVYRKRKGDETLPIQLRYHVPIEVMYVILPIITVGVLYFYTARDLTEIESRAETPDRTIQVIGKQWSWDFNYVDDDVYETGQQAGPTGGGGVPETLPTLYLPVGERIEFELHSRDVNHSFWVPAFLYKKDVIAGRTNYFQIIPEREGLYAGKCAELCGEYHSEMLFNVKVVSEAGYEEHMQDLRDRGQTGELSLDLSRRHVVGGTEPSSTQPHEPGGES